MLGAVLYLKGMKFIGTGAAKQPPGAKCRLENVEKMTPAGSASGVYCSMLSHNAVHAAMAGYTAITVGVTPKSN